MTMPYVRPQLPNNESYLCTGVAVDPNTEHFITGFTPLASRNTVHHLMVIGKNDFKREVNKFLGGMFELCSLD